MCILNILKKKASNVFYAHRTQKETKIRNLKSDLKCNTIFSHTKKQFCKEKFFPFPMFEQEQYDVGCYMNKTYKTVAKLFKLMQMNWCGYGLKQTIFLLPMSCTVRERVPKAIVALITQQQIPR